MAYYDSNPHNPLGLIRGGKETEKLADLMAHHSEQNEKRDYDDGYFGGRQDPITRIRLIDDVVYNGLEYKGSEKPVSFAQVGAGLRNTFVLAGISKVGLVSLRGGLVIGKSSEIHELRLIQRTLSYVPPAPAMHALSAYFNDAAPFAGWRDSHLKKLNAAHEFSGKFMKALINGLGDAGSVSAAEEKKMIKLLMSHADLSDGKAQARLARGVKNVRVITSPHAGFFHMLDFSACEGMAYEGYSRWKDCRMVDEEGIVALLKDVSLKLAPGSYTGLEGEQMIMRVSFAKDPADILDFVDRLEKVFSKKAPSSVLAPVLARPESVSL
ncbi:MAG: aminotransferase class I/II-fold pyridoxal phosphate-dependent enzyme [Alphaproteobacteria bacterium]|nr:aminotransferase class I/II-fold pyridoxal phosphate-dependent enzyme [Alphaproteobacteria bacterium]